MTEQGSISETTWIFQAVPEDYNIQKEVPKRLGRGDEWTVTRFRDKVLPRNRLLFWSAGKQAGIYATGRVSSVPFKRDGDWWVQVKFDGLIKPVLKETLRNHSVLKQLSIIRQPRGTNFEVTPAQWSNLKPLIRTHHSALPPLLPKFQNLTNRKAVLRALAESDRIGREAFLAKHGFKKARSYLLFYKGKAYDSKAIVGVAYGYQFGTQLNSGEFNGGKNTIVPKLAKLGFEVMVDSNYEAAEFEKAVQTALKDKSGRASRLAKANRMPVQYEVLQLTFRRNPDVVAEVLERAAGQCECCEKAAPFRRVSNGTPYLEVHHKQSLADGGEDVVENAIALCPNCHRREHHGKRI